MNYKTLLPLLLCLSFLFGCSETSTEAEELSDISKIQILLNESKNVQAIALIQQELEQDPYNEELNFYLASAYSSMAGINVYTLYPLLNARLFRESAINWDTVNDINPYVELISGLDNNTSFEINQNDIEAYKREHDLEGDDADEIARQEIRSINAGILGDYLGTVWTFYEIIPLIALAPAIDDDMKGYALQALRILRRGEIFTGSRREDARMFTLVISASLLVNVVKGVLPSNLQRGSAYFICEVNHSTLLSNIEEAQDYIEVVIESASELDQRTASFEEIQDQVNTFQDSLASSLSPIELFLEALQQTVCD